MKVEAALRGTNTRELRQQAEEVLFGDVRTRPHPHSMAALILRGLTPRTIIEAGARKGFPVPRMDKTLHDLQIGLPHYQNMAQTLLEEYDVLINAGRDAEVIYDLASIACVGSPNGGKEVHLLPATSLLWVSLGMSSPSIARPFLQQYGVTRSRVVGDEKIKFGFADSGYRGSVGRNFDDTVKMLYGVSLLQEGRMNIRLACSTEGALGTPILNGPAPQHDELQKVAQFYQPAITNQPYGRLTMSMQVMPRYHAGYTALVRHNDSVVALPDPDSEYNRDVDRCVSSNSSIVNPTAAAITQFLTVAAALESLGGSDFNFAIQPQPDMPPAANSTRSLVKRMGQDIVRTFS